MWVDEWTLGLILTEFTAKSHLWRFHLGGTSRSYSRCWVIVKNRKFWWAIWTIARAGPISVRKRSYSPVVSKAPLHLLCAELPALTDALPQCYRSSPTKFCIYAWHFLTNALLCYHPKWSTEGQRKGREGRGHSVSCLLLKSLILSRPDQCFPCKKVTICRVS